MSPKLDIVVDIENSTVDIYTWTIPRPSFSSEKLMINELLQSSSNISIKSKASQSSTLSECFDDLNRENVSHRQCKDLETSSTVSSTNFTIINGISELSNFKKSKQCWCTRHQLTVLVTTMTIVLFLAILYCLLYVHFKNQVLQLKYKSYKS
ncbi:uncharacterized protein LOC126893813 [Daktulosphaira vitifoliae]|uniref:uncharacterized protein LOC126893813 n=1 Tax=Daktulosphaira vitifoliae TaxID=58002 RepID=UPI0021AA37F0|nr:uncharacterized protein LOC126893813 [Daktulosphaira vitifoliae]